MPDLVPGHLLTKLAHQVANGAGALDEKPQHNFTYSCWSFIGLPFLLHHDDCADDVCLRVLMMFVCGRWQLPRLKQGPMHMFGVSELNLDSPK